MQLVCDILICNATPGAPSMGLLPFERERATAQVEQTHSSFGRPANMPIRLTGGH